MTKNPAKLEQLVSWQDNGSETNTRGIITQHVSRPHYIEINPKGDWVLLTLDKDDKPVYVDRGSARNVVKAKGVATASAISKIPELKAALQTSTPEQNEPKQRVYLVSARRATMRVYGVCATLVLATLWSLYWLFVARPKIAVLFVILLSAGIYLSHMLLTALERANQKREKLVKQQQARAMIAQAKQGQGAR